MKEMDKLGNKKTTEELVKELKESKTAFASMCEDVGESKKALLNILEDVESERKKVEEEKNKTSSIIANLADGLLLFDWKQKISLVNLEAEKLLGIEGKVVVGMSIPELGVYGHLKPIINLLEQQEVSKLFRKEVTLQGDLILEITAVQLLGKEDKVSETLVILHDITREKLVERMKTDFVALAAHQLRTPLSAIKWTFQMFLDDELGEINQEQRNLLQKAHQYNEKMLVLINDLLNVTRIEEGKYTHEPVLSSIESVVDFVLESSRDDSDRKGIKLEIEKPPHTLPDIFLDTKKMQLVLQNLVDNAINYTPSGGQIKISLKDTEENIEVAVKDTGVGIPKPQQEVIFSKFFRGSNAIKIDPNGTGLGLFITKSIVESHGGRIWFESEENKGTSFYFTLPLLRKNN